MAGGKGRRPHVDAALSPTVAGGPATDPTLRADEPAPDAATPGGAATVSPGVRLGRFVVIDTVGAGGMGVVFAAYDPQLDRKVALKLVRTDSSIDVDVGRARLLREAQAMARLAHPNVVAVHDTGMAGDDVFIAMEYVDGQTLRAWCDERKPTWRELLRIGIEAGRGLAAAHAHGLVHRDFKPDNVLVGRDGRTRVTDFGLASTGPRQPAHDPQDPSLTGAGTVVGTPRYMSPEQHEGAFADARSDQFGFCVALFEALYGVHPFGDSSEEQLGRVRAGELRRAPAGPVPTRIELALRRGLSHRPADRYADMGALLADLEHASARGRTPLFATIAIAGALGAAVTLTMGSSDNATSVSSPCEVGPSHLAGVWDDAVRQDVHDAFAASGRGFAMDSFDRLASSLDRWTGAWIEMRRDTCEATEVRREQSAQLLDLRMACLDRRLDRARAFTRILATQATSDVLERAIAAAEDLPSVTACAATESLLTVTPPPGDAEERARIASVRATIDESEALLRTGSFAAARQRAEVAIAEAAPLGYAPLDAEARFALGAALEALRDTGAPEAYNEALQAAASARDDRLAALAWVRLLTVLPRPADAQLLIPGAEAAVRRAGDEPGMRAQLLLAVAAVRRSAGEFETAVRDAEAALAAVQSTHDPLDQVRALEGVAWAHRWKGAWGEAHRRWEEAIAARIALQGSDHPDVAAAMLSDCEVLRLAFELDAARAACDGATAVLARDFDVQSSRYADAVLSRANVDLTAADYAAALPRLRAALEVYEKVYGETDKRVGFGLVNVGITLAHLHEFEEAEQALRRAHSVLASALGADHPSTAAALTNLGQTLLDAGKPAPARTEFSRALAIREAKQGVDHPQVAYDLTGVGRALIEEGRAADAVPLLERALELRLTDDDPTNLGETQFHLARALWQVGSQRPKAMTLATEARANYASAPPGYAAELAEVDAWLAKRR